MSEIDKISREMDYLKKLRKEEGIRQDRELENQRKRHEEILREQERTARERMSDRLAKLREERTRQIDSLNKQKDKHGRLIRSREQQFDDHIQTKQSKNTQQVFRSEYCGDLERISDRTSYQDYHVSRDRFNEIKQSNNHEFYITVQIKLPLKLEVINQTVALAINHSLGAINNSQRLHSQQRK